MIRKERVYAAALDSPDPKLIVEENTGVAYANGYLFFTKDGNLVAQPFDPDHLTLSGNPVPVAPKVEYYDSKSLGNFSVSENGVLIYRSAFSSPSRLVWLDRTGKQLANSRRSRKLRKWTAVPRRPHGCHCARRPNGRKQKRSVAPRCATGGFSRA